MDDLSEFFDESSLKKPVMTICHYFFTDVEGEEVMCGAWATKALAMPEPIPDMPVCQTHHQKALDDGWTDEDSYLIVMGFLYENGIIDDTSDE